MDRIEQVLKAMWPGGIPATEYGAALRLIAAAQTVNPQTPWERVGQIAKESWAADRPSPKIPRVDPVLAKRAGRELLAVKEAAQLLGVDKSTILKYVKRGKLHAQRHGRAIVVSTEDLERIAPEIEANKHHGRKRNAPPQPESNPDEKHGLPAAEESGAINASEAARQLGIAPTSLLYHVKRGRLPAKKTKSGWELQLADVIRFAPEINRQQVQASKARKLNGVHDAAG